MLMCFRVTIVFTFTWAAKEEVLGNTCGRGVTCLEVTAPSLLPLIPLASPLPLTCACVRGGGLPVCRISATVTSEVPGPSSTSNKDALEEGTRGAGFLQPEGS